MKKIFLIQLRNLFVMVCTIFIAFNAEAYDIITTTTLTGTPPPYSDPQGAIIPPGNTVTIAPGAVVQFNYGLTIDSNAVLINQGDTIKMGNGQRIYLVQAQANDTSHHGGKLILDNNSVITSLSSSVNGALWQGIECLGSGLAGGINHSALLQIDNGTIQYANCAYTHYDPALGFFGGAGRIYAQNATFRNNIRCLDVGSTWYMPTSNPDSIAWIGNYVENSSFLLTADFPYTPPDMIYEYGAGLICHSCTFHADYYYGTLPNLT